MLPAETFGLAELVDGTAADNSQVDAAQAPLQPLNSSTDSHADPLRHSQEHR